LVRELEVVGQGQISTYVDIVFQNI